jgi:hypothetical protein
LGSQLWLHVTDQLLAFRLRWLGRFFFPMEDARCRL